MVLEALCTARTGSTHTCGTPVVQEGRVNFIDFQGIGPNGPAAFDAWDTFSFVRTN